MPSGLPPVPPPIDEGWVFPIERSLEVTSICPKLGRVSAKYVQDRSGTSFTVEGMGRKSSPADRLAIKAILAPLQGVSSMDVGCWGHEGGQIVVRGPGLKDGRVKEVRIDFLWTASGATPLTANAVYPSVR